MEGDIVMIDCICRVAAVWRWKNKRASTDFVHGRAPKRGYYLQWDRLSVSATSLYSLIQVAGILSEM